jgi:aspartyl-tRNA(Asn)/glutamyl-tRNA(Gln) amidotransferase subunit A
VGLPTSWGAGPLRTQQFDEDATIIARLRDAGAILVSKIAMVELAGGFYNQPNASFTGPGINPWNVDAWSGGSSSGSGSAVGAGCIPFAIGSDTLGSIITPASYCGIAGLRPTYGRVSRHGAMALAWTLDKLGPMCLTADDCGLVLEAIAGPDVNDPTSLPVSFRHHSNLPEHNFKLGVVREGLENAQPEVRRNFEASLSVLSDFCTLDNIDLPDLPYIETGQIIIATEAAAALGHLIENGTIAQLTAPEDRLGIFAGTQVPAVDYLHAMRVRRFIRTQVNTLFQPFDGIISPASLQVASPLSLSFDEYRGKARWLRLSAAGSLSGLPAVTVPNGFGERGLPTGLQVSGASETEHNILAIAHAYQLRTNWHTLHPDV